MMGPEHGTFGVAQASDAAVSGGVAAGLIEGALVVGAAFFARKDVTPALAAAAF
jgi:hypothetical protein